MSPEELTLISVGSHMHLIIGGELTSAVAYAARRGKGDVTCRAFATALAMTDTLTVRTAWPDVLRKIEELQVANDVAALEVGKVVTRDFGQ